MRLEGAARSRALETPGMPPVVQFLIGVAVLAGLLFGGAGRLNLPFFWAYLALTLGGGLANLFSISPGLLRERVSPGPGGTDRALRFIIVPFSVGAPIVAALDARFGWSATPVWVQIVGFGGTAAGLALLSLAMQANPFFSSVVRIQTERGHHLISSGPYRFVRHPGYVGALGYMGFTPLALGSWWALIPSAVTVLLILRRVVVEDRYLQANLPGYVEYAARVRHRLIPGVW
jgi:protein-S-isoprenylcysteine O-methyltransferase Ste14